MHHAEAVADTPAYGTGFARALGAARQQPLVLGRVLGEGGEREVPYGLEEFGDRGRAGHRLTSGKYVPVAITLRRRSSAGSMPSFFASLSICAS